jgi:hypothetical protein
MSAIPPLSGGKPTSGKPAATAAFDPGRTSGKVRFRAAAGSIPNIRRVRSERRDFSVIRPMRRAENAAHDGHWHVAADNALAPYGLRLIPNDNGRVLHIHGE